MKVRKIMVRPLVAATCENATLWVYGEGDARSAVITEGKTEPVEADARPLQAVIAHLDLEEWKFTLPKKA